MVGEWRLLEGGGCRDRDIIIIIRVFRKQFLINTNKVKQKYQRRVIQSKLTVFLSLLTLVFIIIIMYVQYVQLP